MLLPNQPFTLCKLPGMKKITPFIALLFVVVLNVVASQAVAQESTLKEVMKLHIDRPGGANGASVAWHPKQKKYYAAQAGNEAFPMEVFNAKGRMLSHDTLTAMLDVRGLWYNPNTKTLQANAYGHTGWANYQLDRKGIPVSIKKMGIDPGKPDAQAVAVYDPINNVIYYFDYGVVGIERNNMSDGISDTTFALHLGASTRADIKREQDDKKASYNENTLIFTGTRGSEIGLLNVTEKQIELYDLNTGLMTQVLSLPEGAPVSFSLNFSYANGIYWLNDKTERTWHGYKR